jgi:hypothetical protein
MCPGQAAETPERFQTQNNKGKVANLAGSLRSSENEEPAEDQWVFG